MLLVDSYFLLTETNAALSEAKRCAVDAEARGREEGRERERERKREGCRERERERERENANPQTRNLFFESCEQVLLTYRGASLVRKRTPL